MEISPAEREAYDIEPARPEDAEGVRAVVEETWLDTYPNEEFGITPEAIRSYLDKGKDGWAERFQARLESSASLTWVAKANGRVVAFCSARKEPEKEVGAIYVLPQYQGKGLGEALMRRAMDWLGEDGEIILRVAAYNGKAIAFYKKLGFEESGREKSSRKVGDKDMPELTLVRRNN